MRAFAFPLRAPSASRPSRPQRRSPAANQDPGHAGRGSWTLRSASRAGVGDAGGGGEGEEQDAGRPRRSQPGVGRAAAGAGAGPPVGRGGEGDARLARPPAEASITPPPDLGTPGSRWRPSSRRNREEERGYREASPQRERGDGINERKNSGCTSPPNVRLTYTRAPSSRTDLPDRTCAGKGEKGGCPFFL